MTILSSRASRSLARRRLAGLGAALVVLALLMLLLALASHCQIASAVGPPAGEVSPSDSSPTAGTTLLLRGG